MIERGAKDYSRIRYYIDARGRIWHGPFCREENTHWKMIDEIAVGNSYLPDECVEITPYQAAQEVRRRNDMKGGA